MKNLCVKNDTSPVDMFSLSSRCEKLKEFMSLGEFLVSHVETR